MLLWLVGEIWGIIFSLSNAAVDFCLGEEPRSRLWSRHIPACDRTDYPSTPLGEPHLPSFRTRAIISYQEFSKSHDSRVPILLTVAVLTLVFGQDHPAGTWSQRHTLPATAIAIAHGHQVHIDADEKLRHEDKKVSEEGNVEVHPVDADEEFGNVTSTVDFAVNESLTFKTATEILLSPLTWLPALAYLTTFGLVCLIESFDMYLILHRNWS